MGLLGPLPKRVVRKPRGVLHSVGRISGGSMRSYGHGHVVMIKDPTTGKYKYQKRLLRRSLDIRGLLMKAFGDLPKKGAEIDYEQANTFQTATRGTTAPNPIPDPEVEKEAAKIRMVSTAYQSMVPEATRARYAGTANYDDREQAVEADNNVIQNIDTPALMRTINSLITSLKREGALK